MMIENLLYKDKVLIKICLTENVIKMMKFKQITLIYKEIAKLNLNNKKKLKLKKLKQNWNKQICNKKVLLKEFKIK